MGFHLKMLIVQIKKSHLPKKMDMHIKHIIMMVFLWIVHTDKRVYAGIMLNNLNELPVTLKD